MSLPNFSNDEIMPTTLMSDSEVLGSGDVVLYKNFVSESEANELFEELSVSVDFQQWYHMPSKNENPHPLKRIKRIMANIDCQERIPYYRFPVNDQISHGMITPMMPVVENLRKRINEMLNVDLNHVVVLLYRDGSDCIGYHKDKTLDLDEEAPIISLSLGGTRTYCLQDLIFNPKIHQEIELENGTLLVLGGKTNNTFYHSIKPSCDSDAKPRISITFRRAVTYLLPDGSLEGKGELYQTLNWPEELKGNHVEGYSG